MSGLASVRNKDAQASNYLIPRRSNMGCDTLVSIGGIQSNQTRFQVAAVAAHLGMKCVLVQENWVNYPTPHDRVGNIEMSCIMGLTYDWTLQGSTSVFGPVGRRP